MFQWMHLFKRSEFDVAVNYDAFESQIHIYVSFILSIHVMQ